MIVDKARRSVRLLHRSSIGGRGSVDDGADTKRLLLLRQSTTPYETRYFDQYVDHFNPNGQQQQTYKQRYLWNDTFWGKPTGGGQPLGVPAGSKCPGPILFYTGNESPVTYYYPSSGQMTDVVAPMLGALLIFAEHRYWGESIPCQEGQTAPCQYQSAHQALADYANLLETLKRENPAMADCPVIAYGGSYGGMLTAWFRLRYGNVVVGGLAASAPVTMLGTARSSPYGYMDAVEATFKSADSSCPDQLHTAFQAMVDAAGSSAGQQQLTSLFELCSPVTNQQDALSLAGTVQGQMSLFAELDYPYPVDYDGIEHLAGHPVNVTCRAMAGPGSSMARLAAGIKQAYWNSTGTKKCFDWNGAGMGAPPAGPQCAASCGWGYLSCIDTFLINDLGTRGMFVPHNTGTLEQFVQQQADGCQQAYDVTLRPFWMRTAWAGLEFGKAGASNIIFSNGLLDPWHSGGVLTTEAESLPAIVIPNSAHHFDLRGPNPADPVYVQQARKLELQYIKKWLSEYADTFSQSK